MTRLIKAKAAEPEEPPAGTALPVSWRQAAGILRRRVDPVRYQRQVRKRWETRRRKAASSA